MSDQPKEQPGQTGSAGQSAIETAAEATERVTNAGLSLAEQFSKRIAEMQLFAMPDMDAVTTAHRRNMEALSAAYRAALEGAQAVSRRNGEIIRQAMADMEEGGEVRRERAGTGGEGGQAGGAARRPPTNTPWPT